MEKLQSHSNLRLDLDSAKQQESILGLLEGRIDKVDHNLIYVRSDANDPSINGHRAFTQFSQTSAYQQLASGTESQLIQHNATAINQSTRKTKEIVELGPGNNKFVKYADICKLPKSLKYCAADMSMPALIQADDQAKIMGYQVTNRIANDRLQSGVFDKVNNGSYWCFGGSVGNIGVENLLRSLKSSSYTSGSTAVMTYFVAPDPQDDDYEIQVQKLRAMYGASDTPFSDPDAVQKARTMILKPFEALGFDPNCLELDVKWVDAIGRSPAKIVLGARVVKDFMMEVNGQQIRKKTGDVMSLIESARFTKAQFAQQVKGANCDVLVNDTLDGMALAVVKLQPKKVNQTIKKVGKMVIGALTMLGMGIGGGEYLEKQRVEKEREERMKNAFTSWTDHTLYGVGSKKSIDKMNDQLKSIGFAIDLLQERYSVSLTGDQAVIVQGMMVQWMKNTGKTVIPVGDPSGMRAYDMHATLPDPIEEFIESNRLPLEEILRSDLIPNHNLAQYKTVLSNSYFYVGEHLTFDQVDEELDDYVGYLGGLQKDGHAVISHYKTGIKIIKGKRYFVASMDGGESYSLIQRDQNPYLDDGGMQKIVVNIIGRGQINILASQIRKLLIDKYGDQSPYYLNGQGTIVNYLSGLYAKGYDLSYLLGGEYDGAYNKSENLLNFTLSYIIPDIGNQLFTSYEHRDSPMPNIDLSKVSHDAAVAINLQTKTQEIYNFITKFSGQTIDKNTNQRIHSTILQFLVEGGSDNLNFPSQMRKRVVDRKDVFEKLGYILYGATSDLDILKNINPNVSSLTASQIVQPYGVYRCNDGSILKLGLDGNSHLLAQPVPTKDQREKIFNDHKKLIIQGLQKRLGNTTHTFKDVLTSIENNKDQIVDNEWNRTHLFTAKDAQKIVEELK